MNDRKQLAIKSRSKCRNFQHTSRNSVTRLIEEIALRQNENLQDSSRTRNVSKEPFQLQTNINFNDNTLTFRSSRDILCKMPAMLLLQLVLT